jgi:hypothetical protein
MGSLVGVLNWDVGVAGAGDAPGLAFSVLEAAVVSVADCSISGMIVAAESKIA